MNDRMVHRGPDDEGVYVDTNSGLAMGARRLSIIDLAGGHQPIANEDETVWAALNGEIYNHPELREHLRRSGHTLRSGTDTEVLVHLYERYGTRLTDALDGMYAFAIWDRPRRRLILARDRFGEKPLFYRHDADGLTFASELTALRAGLPTEPELDPESLDAYLSLGYVPGERTIFAGIRALPAAHTLVWSPDRSPVQLSSNWTMPDGPTTSPRSLSEYADEAKTILRRSVTSRLIADVPVGVMLSGGLDSNIVAALVAEVDRSALRTFTVSYDVGSFGEAEAAQATADRLGTDHHALILTAADVAERAPRVLEALDQPNADPALIALQAVSELARQHVTVALGGEGADELFGGYPRYRWGQRAARAADVLPGVVAAPAARLLHRASDRRAQRFADVISPRGEVERQIEWVAVGSRSHRHRLCGERMRDTTGLDVALADAKAVYGLAGEANAASRLMRLDQQRYLVDDVLAKADRASMQMSLEMRSPYLSRDVAEFAAVVPSSLHLSHGGKAVLRAVASLMPGVGRPQRRKTAFEVPLTEWLRGPLAPMVRELEHESRLVAGGWIDGRELNRLIAGQRAGAAGHNTAIWSILVAERSVGDAAGT